MKFLGHPILLGPDNCPIISAQENSTCSSATTPDVIGLLTTFQPFFLPVGHLTCKIVDLDEKCHFCSFLFPEVYNLPMHWPPLVYWCWYWWFYAQPFGCFGKSQSTFSYHPPCHMLYSWVNLLMTHHHNSTCCVAVLHHTPAFFHSASTWIQDARAPLFVPIYVAFGSNVTKK
jgi:hypothetical protein